MMSDYITYPASGVTELTIEEIARDGVARGVPGTTQIQVVYEPFERDTAPSFVAEGTAVRFTGAVATRVFVPEGIGLTIGQARGDLRVQGLNGEIKLDVVRGDLRLDTLSNVVVVGEADGDVRAEGVADLRLTSRCHGDLRFDGGGALAIADLSGDLRLSVATSVHLGYAHGDLWAEKVTGSLQIEHVDGDTRLSEIGGLCTLDTLSGDFRGAGLAGGLTATRIGGDAALTGPFVSPEGYTLAADGDVHVQLPADADLRLTVRASGRIRSDVPLTPMGDGSPTFSASVGQGTGRVNLVARGDARITHVGAPKTGTSWEPRGRTGSDPFAELSNLGERIRQQVTTSLASAGIIIETGEPNLGRGDRKRGQRGYPPSSPPPPTPPSARARHSASSSSSEEQMAILKMVEDGKITAEEAETLLKALGAYR